LLVGRLIIIIFIVSARSHCFMYAFAIRASIWLRNNMIFSQIPDGNLLFFQESMS
jgi:predicted alpha/beta superfamily hydrolase